MVDREIIHCASDVSAFLKMAHELGLIVRIDAPSELPKPIIASADCLEGLDRGVFALYRPDWIFGEQQFQQIPAGYNVGKYSQSPRVNSTQISAYFGGERRDGEVRRLGVGVISWHNLWYDSRLRTECRTPPEVRHVYGSLMAALGTGVYLSGGVHRYLVFRNALKQFETGEALPPFDYIEWPPAPGSVRRTKMKAPRRAR
jgi:hypothetical protein